MIGAGEQVQDGRLVELDALRGIAAICVLGFHFLDQFGQSYRHIGGPLWSFSAGRYGVQLFFVISGFVILMSLEKTRSAGDFLVARFSRLFPAFWVAVLITVVAVSIAGLPGQSVSLREVVLNLTMFPDFLNVREVDGSYWTLQIELFFYIQMLFWFWAGALSRIRYVIVLWLAMAAAYAVALQAGYQLSYTVREVLDLRYIPYFSVGMLLYRLHRDRRTSVPDGLMVLSAIGITGLTWGGMDAVVLLGIVAVFLLMISGKLAFLSWRPLLFLGGISYTTYLLHQQIGFIIIYRLEHAGFSPLSSIVIASGAVLVLAWLLTRVVEQPALAKIRRLRMAHSGRAGG